MNCSFSKEEVWFPELLKNPDSTELLQKFKEAFGQRLIQRIFLHQRAINTYPGLNGPQYPHSALPPTDRIDDDERDL